MSEKTYKDHSPVQHTRSALTGVRRAAVSRQKPTDGLVREDFTLPRDAARAKARDWLEKYPKAAYWSRVEHWRQLPDGDIEFTMVRLPTAD